MDAVFELTVRVEIVIWVFFNITDLIRGYLNGSVMNAGHF